MRHMGIQGARRGRKPFTTISAEDGTARPADLVQRQFSAPAPNRLWLCDITYVRTWSGMVYVSFVIDCFARMIVGWQASRSLRTDLALDALEQAIWTRQDEGLGELIHHSDRGSQYLSIRYTERLAEAGGVHTPPRTGRPQPSHLASELRPRPDIPRLWPLISDAWPGVRGGAKLSCRHTRHHLRALERSEHVAGTCPLLVHDVFP
jgi:putative transposase